MARFSRLHPFLLPGIILAIGLTTTALLWSLTDEHARQAKEREVEFLAAQVANRIENQLRDNVQILRGVAGLFDTPEWITRERFHRYVGALRLEDEYPGIQGIGFFLLIPDDEKDARVAAIQREGFPQFEIYPSGERPFYAAVLYLAPFNVRNQRAIGYDMAPEPLRWTAAMRARDQAAVALSAKVTLVSEDASDTQPGFMLFLPIYRADTAHDSLSERRANLLGWAASPLRMRDLMQDILQPQRFDLAHPGVQVDVYDGDREAPETRLFTSGPVANRLKADGAVRKTQRLTFGGHQWSIAVSAPPVSKFAVSPGSVAWIGLSGVIGSLLLAGLFSVQTQAQHRIAIANGALERANRQLAEQERLLRWGERTAQLGSWTFDPSTAQTRWSQGMFSIWGLDPNQGAPSYEAVRRYIHPDDWDAFDQAVRKAVEQDEPYRLEVRIRRPGGEVRTIVAICTPHRDAQGQGVLLAGTNQDITEQKQAELLLEATKQKLQAALHSMSDAVFISDTAGTFVEFNEAFATFHKFANKSVCGKRLADFPKFLDVLTLDGDLVTLENWVVPRALRGEAGNNVEFILKRRDTGESWIGSYNFTPLRNAEDDIVGSVVTARDITERKRAEEHLYFTQRVVDQMHDSVFWAQPDGRLVYVNEAACRGLGYDRDELLTLSVLDIIANISADGWAAHWDALKQAGGQAFECQHRRKDGSLLWVEVAVVYSSLHGIEYACGLARDITERLRLQEALHEASIHDALTGLFNRRYLDETLPLELARRQRDDSALVVAMLDLDHFKAYNDDYGHEAGDCALRALGDLLQRSLRQGDLACRYGGEEFTIVLHGARLEDAFKRLDALRQAIMQLKIASSQHGELPKITASIGAASAESNETNAAALLARADAALYQAKAQGRNRVAVATETANT